MGDDWAEDRLAFVHGKEIADSAGAVFVEGAGAFEEVEDCGEDLHRRDGGVQLDGWKTWVGLWIYVLVSVYSS